MLLLEFVEAYLSQRDVSEMYAQMLRAHCRRYWEWIDRPVAIADLNCDSVNQWIHWLKLQAISAQTVDTYRRNLLCVWNAAFADRLNDNAPLRVIKIKKPRRVIRCFTHAEIKQLLDAASKRRGRHKNGNRRADFWMAMIHSAYSTGLRRSDLLLVFKCDISPDGTLVIEQHKTGNPLCVRFSPEALKYIGRLSCTNGLALPWPYRKDAMAPRFRMLRDVAGILRGSLKWLRRSAGSYAEAACAGNGSRLLGHRSPQVFKAHYADLTICNGSPISPPPLV